MRPVGFLAALLVCEAAIADVTKPIVIALRDQVQISAAHIQLGDVAEIRGANEAQRVQLATMKIGPAPRLGTGRVVQQKEISRFLQHYASKEWFIVEGSETRVTRPVAMYSGAQFADAARNQLLAHLTRARPDFSKIEVTVVSTPESLPAPAGPARIVVRQIQGDGLGKRVSVWVDLEVNGAVYRSVPVWLSVSAYRPVVVAQRGYAFREPLTTAGFVVEEREIAGVRGALLDASAVANARSRRTIAAGAIVVAADVEPAPSVLAEQEVDVRVVSGSVAIDTRAIAEQEGSLGDIIRVRNPASTATYMARVVGSGKTQVVE